MRIKFFENEFYIKIHAKNLSVFDYGASNMIYKISIFFLLLMVAILFALMNEKGGKIINAWQIFEKEKKTNGQFNCNNEVMERRRQRKK